MIIKINTGLDSCELVFPGGSLLQYNIIIISTFVSPVAASDFTPTLFAKLNLFHSAFMHENT